MRMENYDIGVSASETINETMDENTGCFLKLGLPLKYQSTEKLI